jgi:hypothetical protein
MFKGIDQPEPVGVSHQAEQTREAGSAVGVGRRLRVCDPFGSTGWFRGGRGI